jgi:peptidoglycan/LPS O-acetylase OafA/YrhL
VFAFIVGLLPHLLLPTEQSLYWARPWYLGAFGLGMCATCIDFRPDSREFMWLRPLSRFLPFLTGLSVAVLLTIHFTIGLPPSWPIDTLIAVTTVLIIMCCVHAKRWENRRTVFLFFAALCRLFEHPVFATIATFSYTAYMLQHIVFKACNALSVKIHLNASGVILVNLLIGVPLVLALSHFLARYIEKPFLSSSPTNSATK